jgi:hypothetical protein
MNRRATSCAAALWLILAASAAVAQPLEMRTLKERLSDKASDGQRVDNCRVPPERRGPEPRPDCAPPHPASPAAEAASPANRR